MKRFQLSLFLVFGVAFGIQAQADLGLLDSDIASLMTGTTRDLAWSMGPATVAGDLVADASIDGVLVYLPGIGARLSDQPGRILRSGAHDWQFAVELPVLLKSLASIDLDDYSMVPLPALKLGLGFGLGDGWDIVVSGFYVDHSWLQGLTASVMPAGTTVSWDSGSFGFRVRKALIRNDGDSFDLSVGLRYQYAAFALALGMDHAQEIGPGQQLSLKGTLGFDGSSHVGGLEMQISRNWDIFIPYARLSGLVQSTIVNGNADLATTLASDSRTIRHQPSATVNEAIALLDFGFDLTILHIGAGIELGKASLDVQEFSLTGIKANGISLNAGLKFQF